MISEHLAAAHPWRRLWMPRYFYSRQMFFWQLRLSGAGVTMPGAFLVVVSVVGLLQRR